MVWPPNHDMIPVALQIALGGNASAANCSISNVSSNELATVPGGPDWGVTGPLAVSVRADRDGNGIGRIYTITVTCSAGTASVSKSVSVTVPHDQGK